MTQSLAVPQRDHVGRMRQDREPWPRYPRTVPRVWLAASLLVVAACGAFGSTGEGGCGGFGSLGGGDPKGVRIDDGGADDVADGANEASVPQDATTE